MSIAARYENGVFRPLEEVKDAAKGKMYRVFSEEELCGLKDDLTWLKASERSFDFWDNEEDAVYDSL
jgi:predicted DNA-binding antitoxin AbrB/MazE fold protein